MSRVHPPRSHPPFIPIDKIYFSMKLPAVRSFTEMSVISRPNFAPNFTPDGSSAVNRSQGRGATAEREGGEGRSVLGPDLPVLGTSRAATRANSERVYVPRSVVAHSIDCFALAAAKTILAGPHDVASRPSLWRIPRDTRTMRATHMHK